MSENIKPMSPLEARALQIARWYALASGSDPSASPPDYLPRTPEAAEAFMPHEWVTVAIMDSLIGAPVSHNGLRGADVIHKLNKPEGFALVPMRLTRAMQEVFNDESWEWRDLLAVAEAITVEQYDHECEDIPPAAVTQRGSCLIERKATKQGPAEWWAGCGPRFDIDNKRCWTKKAHLAVKFSDATSGRHALYTLLRMAGQCSRDGEVEVTEHMWPAFAVGVEGGLDTPAAPKGASA